MAIEQTVTDAGASVVKSVNQNCDVAVLDVRLDQEKTILPIALGLARRGTPLLFYTACDEGEIKALQRHFTASLVLRKPATPDQLLSAILAALDG